MKKARCAAFWSMIMEGIMGLIIILIVIGSSSNKGHRRLRGTEVDGLGVTPVAFDAFDVPAFMQRHLPQRHLTETRRLAHEGYCHHPTPVDCGSYCSNCPCGSGSHCYSGGGGGYSGGGGGGSSAPDLTCGDAAKEAISRIIPKMWYVYVWLISIAACFIVACKLICPCCGGAKDQPALYMGLMNINLAGAIIHGYPWINFLIALFDCGGLNLLNVPPGGLGWILFALMMGLFASRVFCVMLGRAASQSSVGTAV